jgi:hypothetical protein
MKLTLVSLVLPLLLAQPSEPRQACFKKGECKDSFQIMGKVVDDQYSCRLECQSNSHCTWFTFYTKTNYCQLFRNCFKLDKECIFYNNLLAILFLNPEICLDVTKGTSNYK